MRPLRHARRPSHTTMHPARRGRLRISSFQGLMVVCFGAAAMIFLLRYIAEPQRCDGKLRGCREPKAEPREGKATITYHAPPRPHEGGIEIVKEDIHAPDAHGSTHEGDSQDMATSSGKPRAQGKVASGENTEEWGNGKTDNGHFGQGAGAGGNGKDSRGSIAKAMANGIPPDSQDILARSDDDAENDDTSDTEADEHGGEGDKVDIQVERGEQDGKGEDDSKQVEGQREQRRRYLNKLVDDSVDRMKGQECNVAFVKTHKTASTTLTAVLYRYGVRHGQRVARFDVDGTAVTLESAAKQTKKSGKRANIFHYHHVWDGYFKSTWARARQLFGNIMVEPKSSIKYVTVLRDPVEHWLSYYYFYYHPENHLDVDRYFSLNVRRKRSLNNPMAAEFGIYNQKDLDTFILEYLPTFSLIMLTEEVDEGLVLLGKVLGWDPIDLTYASLLETRDDGFIRWDNKRVKKAPKTESLSAKTLAAISKETKLDALLYKAAQEYYEVVKAEHAEGLEEAIQEFRGLQTEMLAFLDEEPQDSPAREWYMPELDYYFYSTDSSTWWKQDYPPALPF